MKLSIPYAIAVVVAALTAAACSTGNTDTLVRFSLTDAPVASDTVKEVYIRFSSLKINESTSAGEDGSGWTSIPIDTDREYELLSLSNGITAALGSIELQGGTRINQIRFGISSLELVEADDAEGDPRHPVVLASETGLKIVNAFDIPLSGSITVVADFDVRKSLVYASDTYKMKPVLRAIVENEAGEIRGTAPAGHIVFAYSSVAGQDIDTDFTDEADDADSAAFDDAYTSAAVRDDGTYTLAFMDAGSYDLVLVDAATGLVAQVANDVIVESAKETVLNISL